MSFLVKRQSKEKILSKIAQTTMVNRSRMRDVGDTRQDYEELDSAINSGLYLKDVMNRQGEDFYYMHTLIEVTAPDPETLEQRATEVEKLCVSVDMIARRCDYKNEQAFLSSLPILALDPDIERKARRNALTSGVAAAFPFASYELSDHNGIFLGLNLYNRSPVFLDPYDDYKYTNGNWWIGGSTGAGKTVTLQCLGGRLRQQGKRVIIIAPKKGHEFRPLCEKLGGLYLRMSPSSKDCPNLMAIRRKSLDSYAKLKNIAARDDSVLADILRSRRCVKGGSFRPMKRRQSLLPRPRENWITYFPNWAENLALCRRWKSWSRQRKPQRTSSRHCWSSFVGLRRTIRL